MCDHEFEATYCPLCGGITGYVCLFCGEWSDGGDYLAGRDDLWCDCAAADDEDEDKDDDN